MFPSLLAVVRAPQQPAVINPAALATSTTDTDAAICKRSSSTPASGSNSGHILSHGDEPASYRMRNVLVGKVFIKVNRRKLRNPPDDKTEA